MGSFGPNPMLTESPSATTLALPPLILIHDSSGVVYSYLRLKALHRAVYAIHDPGFFDEKACAQSVRELAATYWGLVRQGVPRGEIILGGWSFGGLTALEMAHCMPIDSGYRIKGIIMIDSVNPQYRPENVQAISYEPQFPEQTSVTTRRRISSAMRRATGLVDGWSLPDWDHQSLLPPRTAGSATAQPSSPYPRTILLRAQGWVPVQEEGCLCSIDVGRERRLLGWEDCGWPIVERVLDVTGHHYSVFDEENVGCVGDKIEEAIAVLEGSAAA